MSQSSYKNIVVLQLISYGDAIISTHVLRSLKLAYPDSKITYVTSNFCTEAIRNNPDIDWLRVILLDNKEAAKRPWRKLTAEYQADDNYDLVLNLQLKSKKACRLIQNSELNFMWYGARLLQELKIPLEIPLKTYLYTTIAEQSKAHNFVKSIETVGYRLVMMEIEGFSRQTYWDKDWTNKVIRYLFSKYPKIHIFISRGGEPPQYVIDLQNNVQTDTQKIHYMNFLTVREMSVLFNYCDMMFSVSSGTANACMTHNCKKDILWFEVAKKHYTSAPMGTQNKIIYSVDNLDGFLSQVSNRV